MKRPIVFLDFDGVINNPGTYGAWTLGTNYIPLEPELLERVKRIVEEINALIVVSSTWRLVPKVDVEFIQRDFGDWSHGRFHANWHTVKEGGRRGPQIQQWLDENLWDGPYICLDDDGDFEEHQHLILIDGSKGIQEEDVEKALNVFNSQRTRQVLDNRP